MSVLRTCADCGRKRTIQARGLCSACYGWHTIHRTLDLLFPAAHVRSQSLYCDCLVYVPRPIPAFATSECAYCGRPARQASA